jgi:hypothetical protein
MKPILNQATGSGKILSTDLCGPCPTSGGKNYIFTAQDTFTKLLFMKGLHDKSSQLVASAILEVFLKVGVYDTVRGDLRMEFNSTFSAEWSKLMARIMSKNCHTAPIKIQLSVRTRL